ncbi:MAG: dTDP-glucose 4,6-dehydratase [Melioribacteraceae bacterium]|nr:MAG: dTDP-glucose 4,6-dehydratase [Melioribacteraceae bacterium]
MKVVVAGGAGFIGSHIVEYWSRNDAEVHVIDNFRTGKLENISGLHSVVLHEGSITDMDLVHSVLKNADYVFNLAAMVSIPESIEKPRETININTFGLLNLLEASREHGVKKLVLSSSAAVYGNNPIIPKRTDMKPEPLSPYSITKLSGEYYCDMFTREYGVNTIALRYFNVYGPRQDPNSQYAAAVPIFIHKALSRENLVIHGDGSQTRDFIFVEDVVRANILAATGQTLTGTFNVACGDSISIKELAQKIIEITGSSSKIDYTSLRAGDIKYSKADIDSTRKALGFLPEYDLHKGLAKTVDHYIKGENA